MCPSGSAGLKIRATKSNVSSSSKMSECKPGVYTSYKSHLTRDKALLKLIAKGAQTRRPNQVQSALMRRHFLELTQSFIIPLERYFARLMPLQKSISPYKVCDLPEFNGSFTEYRLQIAFAFYVVTLGGSWSKSFQS